MSRQLEIGSGKDPVEDSPLVSPHEQFIHGSFTSHGSLDNSIVQLITLNVGTIFEEPHLIAGWASELQNTLARFRPKIVVLSFQEIGGKDSFYMNNYPTFCSALFEVISFLSRFTGWNFFSSGLIHERDLSAEHFTALASLYLVEESVKPLISVWDFASEVFTRIDLMNPNKLNEISASACTFVKHKRFKNTKSRKGYLHSRWKIGDEQVDFVNIHLFHDDINSVALQSTPSVYAQKREVALSEALLDCKISDHQTAFIFGDLNIRLDAPDFVGWLRNRHGDEVSEILSIGDKTFFYKHDDDFRNSEVIREMIQFDREIERFNSKSGFARLKELPVQFGPTYCIENRPDLQHRNPRVFAKRFPSWCDRVLFSESSSKFLTNAVYGSIDGPVSMGDHTPVFLAFSWKI